MVCMICANRCFVSNLFDLSTWLSSIRNANCKSVSVGVLYRWQRKQYTARSNTSLNMILLLIVFGIIWNNASYKLVIVKYWLLEWIQLHRLVSNANADSAEHYRYRWYRSIQFVADRMRQMHWWTGWAFRLQILDSIDQIIICIIDDNYQHKTNVITIVDIAFVHIINFTDGRQTIDNWHIVTIVIDLCHSDC
jgi:hypothetical protein